MIGNGRWLDASPRTSSTAAHRCSATPSSASTTPTPSGSALASEKQGTTTYHGGTGWSDVSTSPVTLVEDVDIRCRATDTNSALGRIRTSDTRFRKPVLYPLSYEGVSMWNPWSALSPTVPREAHTSPDSRVGRTVTGIHRIGQALEVVIDHLTYVDRAGSAPTSGFAFTAPLSPERQSLDCTACGAPDRTGHSGLSGRPTCVVDVNADVLAESSMGRCCDPRWSPSRCSNGSLLRAEAVTATSLAPLRRPSDALAARLALIDEAHTRLDLQYYQWASDNVGYLLLDRLIAAADRGVAVRLLIDDLRFRSRTHRAASICVHPHIAVRLFNPWTRRSNMVTEAVEFVMQFSRLDRRMHNKLLVADGQHAIAGGRNIADPHYGLNKAFNLVDFDVLLRGAGVSRLQDVFEAYWNSPPATPASSLDSSVSKSDLDAVRTLVNEQVSKRGDAFPPDLTTNTAWRDRMAADSLVIPEDALHIAFDIPGPTSATRPTQVISALHAAVAGAREELVVVTPFFVPNEMDVGFYGSLVDRGVRIRLLTNSLASNSGTISNSGLDRSRKAVVKAGVELHELRADAADKPAWVTRSKHRRLPRTPCEALHDRSGEGLPRLGQPRSAVQGHQHRDRDAGGERRACTRHGERHRSPHDAGKLMASRARQRRTCHLDERHRDDPSAAGAQCGATDCRQGLRDPSDRPVHLTAAGRGIG